MDRNAIELVLREHSVAIEAVWEALAQYVDNAAEPEEQAPHEAERLDVARYLIARLDYFMAHGKDEYNPDE